MRSSASRPLFIAVRPVPLEPSRVIRWRSAPSGPQRPTVIPLGWRDPRTTVVAQGGGRTDSGRIRQVVARGTGNMATERTLVLIKPDGVRHGQVGEVLRRIETKGYQIVALEMRTAGGDLLAQHYAEHLGKPFYNNLVEFMGSGPVVAAVIEGEQVVAAFRTLAGATDPVKAAPGSIRGDLGRDWGSAVQQNVVHGSDAPESANREIALWFPGL